jgi:hypothetical protein
VRGEIKEFKSKLDETLFVIDCNLTRRHLNNFQRTELALKSKSVLEQIAKQNESLGGFSRLVPPLKAINVLEAKPETIHLSEKPFSHPIFFGLVYRLFLRLQLHPHVILSLHLHCSCRAIPINI